ncbi:MAG: hydroxyacylglutathione hydrolase [Thiomicrorhabdus chilensis]|uniref:hydroxyacylglutathione hydrolase n=1 Tax=Thiomicrorhabdus chilensis TaxID=63656 RepID=UPI0004105F1E|nr:hydroxyacylglutathione hydrolase [Thiomicrorhabdus chilensis]MDX1347510.1 hydroxyacylglutathione hydrolase [Thiomicrorhabdus chilensis]
MNIIGIPALVGTYDNYIWVLHQSQNAWVVDPGESDQVIDFLYKNSLTLKGILITHAHHDHVNGIAALKTAFADAIVYGPADAQTAGVEIGLKEGDQLELTPNFELKVLETPGHTLDHLAYYNDNALFCGDTLFTAGCGRKFTGSYAQFADSILKLRQLDETTGFYCAHEYTLTNLKFAYLVEPENPALIERIRTTRIDYPQIHQGAQSTIAEENATNPFLRFDTPAIKAKLLQRGAVDTSESLFKTLRLWKDELDQSGELDHIDLTSLSVS